jgi:DNA-directed RNA polymerase specialized sigma24 family protein
MAICKNRWRQELEKRNRRTGLQPIQEEAIWEEPETEPTSLKLMDYVEQLGEKCKDLLVSVYYFGQRMEGLAERYGYRTVHSATVQKYKCLERLRKAVSHLSIGQFK